MEEIIVEIFIDMQHKVKVNLFLMHYLCKFYVYHSGNLVLDVVG